jgi:diguanylate cyclase (GGDEF)-like protein
MPGDLYAGWWSARAGSANGAKMSTVKIPESARLTIGRRQDQELPAVVARAGLSARSISRSVERPSVLTKNASSSTATMEARTPRTAAGLMGSKPTSRPTPAPGCLASPSRRSARTRPSIWTSTTILKFSHADGLEEEFHRNRYESATRDPLTSAYNKKFFVERLSSEPTYAVRHKTELSLAMLDLDHFKKVNDIHGHAGGDAILKHFVALVHGLIRGEDVLGRCGGDEFAIIFRETPAQEALNVAERIRKRLEGSVREHQGRPIPVTCSIGVCTMRGTNPVSAGDLLKATDELLYQAKQGGRNRASSG